MSHMTTYIFYVHGMHCDGCMLTIEREIRKISGVREVTSILSDYSLKIVGDFGTKTVEQIMEECTAILIPHGYKVSLEKPESATKWSEFKIAVPIALAFALFFVLLQKVGILNLVDISHVTYGTSFIIGVIASLSTCMAVVGGLVLSMSATYAKEGDRVRPQLMFHGGRIVSFFILGGVIGALGSVFTLNTVATFGLSLIIGIVMLVLGLNLLDTFHWVKKIQPSMPKFIARYAHGVSAFNHTFTPVLVGVATFFLPCGFTQSMQVYTLSTGSFLSGGLTMLAFALGTLPVLALISFSSFSIQQSSKAGIFFKTSGLVVILFALFNIINSLVVVGLIPPVFNF